MRVRQHTWVRNSWSKNFETEANHRAQWLLAFGSAPALENTTLMAEIRSKYPNAVLLGCTTSGEIAETQLLDDGLVLTEIELEQTSIRGVKIELSTAGSSHEAGRALARALAADDLSHVFVLSDGLKVNGSQLALGLREGLPAHVVTTGGLAGDADRFSRTVVRLDESVGEGIVAAVGLYGSQMKIGFGSIGGWDPYGPDRNVTRSDGNVLYELDGEPALDLYKRYLGDQAAQLPSSGLLFPLRIRLPGADGAEVVRTILAVDETTKSLTFAGDVPVGARARLMKANFDRLIEGAASAASACAQSGTIRGESELAVLISCVGRRLVLKQRTEEELESVKEIVGQRTVCAGFYSYGELSPVISGRGCELHNQTMTVTTFAEHAA